MEKNKKIFMIAGEASGDILGARIIKHLPNSIKVMGLGGPEMKKEGQKQIADNKCLSVMGILEIIPNLFKILRLRKQTLNIIKKEQPNAIVTIDSPGFNNDIAKKLKKSGYTGKLIHVVAPQVWAWKEHRAEKIAQIFDHLLCLFDFEPKYFERYGLKCTVIGHPIIENGADKGKKKEFETKGKRIITLLPGSRISEVKRTLPIMIQSMNALNKKFNDLKFILPTVPATYEFIKKNTPKEIKIIKADAKTRYNLFAASNAAIATSGTVSLELGLAKVPHSICYKFAPLTYAILKRVAKTKYANIFNILADKELIPELIQEKCNAEIITQLTTEMLKNPEPWIKKIETGIIKLKAGTNSPSKKAAQTIVKEI